MSRVRAGLGGYWTMFGLFKSIAFILPASLIGLLAFGPDASAARIKDIAFVEGVRANQLVGYGLIVGLNGSGDKTSAKYTTQSVANMLNRMGMKLEPKDIKVKNTAAVLVTAELPSFIKPGSKVDVLVSSLGDATSLQGGTLVSAPLRGPDGVIYAMAQGPVALAGFSAGGKDAKTVKNHQTAGKIPSGAMIEKEVLMPLGGKDEIFISLRSPDFTTAQRMSWAINKGLGAELASAVDAGKLSIKVPSSYRDDTVGFISRIESIDISPDSVTKVIVNERTGTVVMGENVRISTVAISHGDLSVEVKTQYIISQPAPFSRGGETVVQPVTEADVQEERSRLIVLPESVTLGDVVRALNLVGVTPRDLVAILQAMKAAGALQAELEII